MKTYMKTLKLVISGSLLVVGMAVVTSPTHALTAPKSAKRGLPLIVGVPDKCLRGPWLACIESCIAESVFFGRVPERTLKACHSQCSEGCG